MKDDMRIGDLAARAGVTARTVRYYESIGLLPPAYREKGGQHRYPEEAVARLLKIGQLKDIGLSLDEVAEVIGLYFKDPSGVRAKRSVLAILRRHLKDTDEKLETLAQFRSDLLGHIERFERWLADRE